MCYQRRVLTRIAYRSQARSISASNLCRCDAAPSPEVPAGAAKTYSPKVTAIVDEITTLNLLEVADLVDLLKSTLNISDAAMMPAMPMGGFPMGGGAPAGDAEEAEEVVVKTDFDVKLTGFDAAAKIKVIKEVRAITGLGLKEAKEAVEGVPFTVKTGIKKEEADEILEKLKAIGGQVELA